MNAPSPALVAPRPERLQLVGQRRQILAVMHQRLMFGMLVYAGVIALIALRIMWLAAFGDHAGRKEGLTCLVPERGDIVDRDGQPLARTIDAWTIAMHPDKVIGDKLTIASQLAQLMPERGESNISPCCGRESRSFTFGAGLRRDWSKRSMRSASRALQFSANLTGFIRRPALPLMSSAITDIDGHGVAGMERAFDKYLSDPATRGEPLTLTIDSRLQQALEAELLGAMNQFSAIGAAGVMMDIRTGEVLAMTSLPQLNPECARARVQPRRGSIARPLAFTNSDRPSSRSPSRWRWTAGSSKASAKCTIAPNELHVYGHAIHDTDPFGRQCSVAEIMKNSSNIGTAQIAAQVGARAAARFPQEDGLSRSRSRSSSGNAARDTDAGLALGPVRDDDGGIRSRHRGHSAAPRNRLRDLVQRRHLSPGDVAQGRPQPSDCARAPRFFRGDELQDARARAARRDHGTGRKADAPGYRVGGKTGTAEKLLNGHYTSSAVVTSFAGVFPMDDPRYVMVMMLDDPKATAETYGFHTAGVEHRPGVRGGGQPYRANAWSASGQDPRAGHVRSASVRPRQA